MGRLVVALVSTAGVAALFAPSPWSWIGPASALVAVWLGIAQVRRARRRELRTLHRIRDLEEDLESAHEHDALHRTLLSVLSAGVVALQDDVPIYANAAAISMLGDRIVVEGGPLPPEVRDVLARAKEGEEATDQFEQGLPARLLQIIASPPDEDRITVLRLIDITERDRVEAIRRDFVAAASHELETPAAAIQAAAETVLMALEDDPEAVRDFAGRIYDNATRLSRLVSDLLDLSRLEGQPASTEPLDLTQLVTDEIRRFGDSKPQIHLEAESVAVFANGSDLALAVRNLLDNAVRYTPADGRVEVRVRRLDGRVVIEVEDDGPGIPAADLPRIFERFYRVDAARSRGTGGTGLGLAIVKHVAELHGGGVEVESEIGVGSTFSIRLPATAS